MEETREIEERLQYAADVFKRFRKHFSKLGGMFILGTIIIYAVQLIPIILLELFAPELMKNMDFYMLVSMVPMYLVGMPLLILLVRTIPGEAPKRHKMKPGSFVVAAIMSFAITYLSNMVGSAMTWLIGILKGGTVENVLEEMTSSISLWTIFIYMVICAPIMEEYVFRKLIVDRTVCYGEGVAVVVSGLMFGLFHGNLNQFVYAFTLGMFLAFLYAKTGKLKITIALHMMINFVGGFVSTLLLDTTMQGEGDWAVPSNYVPQNSGGLLGEILFGFFVIAMILAGGILLIVMLATKKFTLARGIVQIPKGERFHTVILNVGMLFYCVFWIGMIVMQLFF